MYEKYYLEIVSAIQKKTLISADIMFVWVAAHQPELYAQERVLDEELNTLWDVDFERFKKAVLNWGRMVLQIYKKYAQVWLPITGNIVRVGS